MVIWDIARRSNDYGDQPRVVRRVTIDGPVSVGIDGRQGKMRTSGGPVAARQPERSP
jgi:taurine dioxygenase